MAYDERLFIRLHEGMPDHPKIEPLSDRAFRVLVEAWCWCARQRTDGRIPAGTWRKRGSHKVRRELLDAGLIETRDDGVEVHDYLDWQRSAADIAEALEQKRNAGSLGNHARWHVAGARFDPGCQHCARERASLTRSQPRSHPPWSPGSQTESQPGSQTGSQPLSQMGSQNDRTLIAEKRERREEGGLGYVREVTVDQRARENAPPKINPTEKNERPPERCPRHRDHLDDVPPCGKCADARKAATAYDQRTRAERRACSMCDGDGYRYEPGHRIPLTPYERCDHTTPTQEAKHA